ncbi:isoprenylcysteine carboxylmethyltransferase family protein [Acidobacteria bacterium AB60]|nr:isoprenylcysteine carboxylmethyltransferase family protein [Acidobacteria bacterium AB60]
MYLMRYFVNEGTWSTLMFANIQSAIGYSWAAVGLVWLAGLPFARRTVRSQPNGARFFHLAVAMLGFFLLGSRYFDDGWLGARFLAANQPIQAAGLVITIAGCLVAIWARVTLGRNWSGRATVKAGHRLVVAGPYAFARHPIYSGLLMASVGTGLATGKVRCILGVVLIVLALAIKMSQEERLMLQTFPEAYPSYRRRVKALIPGVF